MKAAITATLPGIIDLPVDYKVSHGVYKAEDWISGGCDDDASCVTQFTSSSDTFISDDGTPLFTVDASDSLTVPAQLNDRAFINSYVAITVVRDTSD